MKTGLRQTPMHNITMSLIMMTNDNFASSGCQAAKHYTDRRPCAYVSRRQRTNQNVFTKSPLAQYPWHITIPPMQIEAGIDILDIRLFGDPVLTSGLTVGPG